MPFALLGSEEHDEPVAPVITLTYRDMTGQRGHLCAVNIPARSLLPRGVSFAPFAPSYYGSHPVVSLKFGDISLDVSIRAFFGQFLSTKSLDDIEPHFVISRSLPHLSEIAHDEAREHIVFLYNVRDHIFDFSDSSPETIVKQAAQKFHEIAQACMDLKPMYVTPFAQWVGLVTTTSDRELRAKLVSHLFERLDDDALTLEACRELTNSDSYSHKFILFKHKPELFFKAIDDDDLLDFIHTNTEDPVNVLPGRRMTTPERFARVFAAHLPYRALADTRIPQPHKVVLARHWLQDKEVDRDELSPFIAQMDASAQRELKALDIGPQGALTVATGSGGELSLQDD